MSGQPAGAPRQPTSAPDGPALFSVARLENGTGVVTLPVIGELDVAAIPGLARAIASLNGDAPAVLLDLSRATLIDSSATRERAARDRIRMVRPPALELSLLGRDQALARIDGRPLTLSRRHTEIITLLSARPGGITSEQLAADLYGDAGSCSTARVEVCRLRKLLGDRIAGERYRLCTDVVSDVERVQGLLNAGAVREAARSYVGPLVPHSDAPGVVSRREALDAWMRHAVMTADDDEALWAWLRSPSGCEDLPAWKRLLAHLSFDDPRRSLTAARIRSLRQAYGAPGA